MSFLPLYTQFVWTQTDLHLIPCSCSCLYLEQNDQQLVFDIFDDLWTLYNFSLTLYSVQWIFGCVDTFPALKISFLSGGPICSTWRGCIFVLCRTGNNAYSIKRKFCIDIDVTQRICKQFEAIEFIYLKLLSYNKIN